LGFWKDEINGKGEQFDINAVGSLTFRRKKSEPILPSRQPAGEKGLRKMRLLKRGRLLLENKE